MNKAELIGRTTKEVELTTTTSGVNVAKFTLAVQRKFKTADGEYESDFINVVAWRNTADFIQKYVKKGDRIGIVGSIQTRTYDAQDGTKRYVTEVVADEVDLLSPKEKTEEQEEKPKEDTKLNIDDGTLPF